MTQNATAPTEYDPDVGRPRKPPAEKYETPRKTWRPHPPENYEAAKIKAKQFNNLTVTDVLNHALEVFLRDDWEDWR